MPIPSNIVLTPDTGIAPFEVQITGDDLFERPNYVAKETFTTAGTDSIVSAWKGVNPTRIDGIIGKSIKITPAISNSVSTDANSLIVHKTSGSKGVLDTLSGGNNLFKASIRTNVQFMVSMWLKPDSINTSYAHGILHLAKGNGNANAGYEYNVPGSSGGLGSTVYSGIDKIVIWKSAGNKLVVSFQGCNVQRNASKLKTIYVDLPLVEYPDSTGINGAGDYEINKWNHLLVQWNGDALGLPDIWINGNKLLQSNYGIIKNDAIEDFWVTTDGLSTLTQSGSFGYSYQGIGIVGRYDSSSASATASLTDTVPGSTPATPTRAAGVQVFPGSICDVYVGDTYLSDNDVLKYANLPKVELLKVV